MVNLGASRTTRVDAASLGSDYGMVHIIILLKIPGVQGSVLNQAGEKGDTVSKGSAQLLVC